MSQCYPLPSFWGTSEYKEQTKQLIAVLDPGPIRDSCFAKSLITASQRNKLQSISFGEEHNRRLLAILENGTNDSFKTFLAILIDQDIAYYGDLLPVLKAVAASDPMTSSAQQTGTASANSHGRPGPPQWHGRASASDPFSHPRFRQIRQKLISKMDMAEAREACYNIGLINETKRSTLEALEAKGPIHHNPKLLSYVALGERRAYESFVMDVLPAIDLEASSIAEEMISLL